MTTLHLPWLEASIIVPLFGAVWVARRRTQEAASKACLWLSAIAFLCTVAAWYDYATLSADIAEGPWSSILRPIGQDKSVLVIDALSAPLLPLASLVYLLTFAVTLRTKLRRFSFRRALVSEAILLATFTCNANWGLVTLLTVGVIPPYLELRARNKPTGVYVFHMLAFVAFLVAGCSLVGFDEQQTADGGWVMAPLVIAVLIRGGIAPFHCWAPDLFEHATFGRSLLFVTPMVGAYAAARLILPVASDDLLRGIGMLAIVSALYAAGMALIQREARRFFCYLFLSHSALVFVGLESTSAVGLTGGLCMWLSIGLSLSGLGLTLRALESRHGRLSLVRFQGLYDHTPALAVCFLLTGLASVGFPGTFGFVGTEMLVDGAVHSNPVLGVAVVIVAALNGIAVVQAYFKIFTGSRHVSTVPLGIGIRERWAVLALAAIIFVGGLFPQPSVASRYRAAEALLDARPAQWSHASEKPLTMRRD